MPGPAHRAVRSIVPNPSTWNVERPDLARSAATQPVQDRAGGKTVGHLATENQVDVIPMHIRGAYRIMPKGRDLPLPAKATVRIGKPLKERHKEQFLARIAQELRSDESTDPERIARAVFAVLARRVSEGEIQDVKHVLPADIRHLWP